MRQHVLLLVVGLLSVWCRAADNAGNPLAQPPANPLAQPVGTPLAQPQGGTNPLSLPMGNPEAQTGTRPPCPAGWREFDNPLVGIKAHVPPEFWARLKGGTMLTVEKVDSPATAAFVIPFRPRSGATPQALAMEVTNFFGKCDPQFRGNLVGQATAQRAVVQFTGVVNGQANEGRFCTLMAAGGSMAFVIGISAPQGQLASQRATLETIARSFGFAGSRTKWTNYQSPGGSFTLQTPPQWRVESSEGRHSKSNVDMVAYSPANPYARAFNLAPRFCTADLMQHPLYQMQGYQVATFADARQCIITSIGSLLPNVQLTQMRPNRELTQLFSTMVQQVAQIIQGLGAGRMDVVVYDCAGQTTLEGRPVLVVFTIAIRTLTLRTGLGQATDLEVGLRGWFAPAQTFLNDSVVLDRVQGSFALTPAFINKVVQGNAQAFKIISDTNRYCNQIDQQITRDHWRAQDAIAEMNYNLLTDNGGYVNQATGRVELMGSDNVIRNSSGQIVSREEVQERHVPPDQATVLRDAYSDDYMRGTYGRIQFYD